MAFTLDKIIFSPVLDPISITHTVGFGSALERKYAIQNIDANEVKINIKSPAGVTVTPTFIQLAPNQTSIVLVTANRTFFDTLPKGSNNFNITFEFIGKGDPISGTSDVIVFELQLTSTPSLTLKVAATATVTAQVMEKNLTKQTQNVAMNKIITYASSNTGVVSVGQTTGLAKGISPGNAQITVSSQGTGAQIVSVGVYADAAGPRWWEKVVVNTTTASRFYAGPFTTNIQPYPVRETRNGILYDVYYQRIEEDHITTTTYYYDWNDITDSVKNLTDAEKLAQGYVPSTTKPAAPAPKTVDGGIVRVVTNAKYEQRIVAVIIAPGVSITPSPTRAGITVTPSKTPPVTPSNTPPLGQLELCTTVGRVISSVWLNATQDYVCRDVQDNVVGGCKAGGQCGAENRAGDSVSRTPAPTPTPSITPSPGAPPQPLCYEYKFWFDQESPAILPLPSINYIDCSGTSRSENSLSFDSSQFNPIIICARTMGSYNRLTPGTVTQSPACQPFLPPNPTPSHSPMPAQTISFGVFGGRGIINGHSGPFSVTMPWGEGMAVSCVPAAGYAFSYAVRVNALGNDIGRIILPDFMAYADGILDEVRAYFVPTAPGSIGSGTGGGGGLLT
jgi:hypothetical protein